MTWEEVTLKRILSLVRINEIKSQIETVTQSNTLPVTVTKPQRIRFKLTTQTKKKLIGRINISFWKIVWSIVEITTRLSKTIDVR